MLPSEQHLIKQMNYEDPGNFSSINVLAFTSSTDHRFAEVFKFSPYSFIDSKVSYNYNHNSIIIPTLVEFRTSIQPVSLLSENES